MQYTQIGALCIVQGSLRILLHVFIIWHVLYNIIIMHMHTVLNSGTVMLDFGLEML